MQYTTQETQEIRIIKQMIKDNIITNIYENNTVDVFDNLLNTKKQLTDTEEVNKLFGEAVKENQIIFAKKGSKHKLKAKIISK